jgi:hypothetical protein
MRCEHKYVGVIHKRKRIGLKANKLNIILQPEFLHFSFKPLPFRAITENQQSRRGPTSDLFKRAN